MKLFISCDMEGTCGITHWDETDYDRGGRWYDYFREQMSREAAAACLGAQSGFAVHGGGGSIRVKDAHDSARNIIPAMLPAGVEIHRGWSGSHLCMVSGLEEGFDALAFTGYHSAAHDGGNPLSHTMVTNVDEIRINGERTSEFLIHSYIAAMLGIPVIFLSGDENLCRTAEAKIPGITTAAVNKGRGNGVVSLQPAQAELLIKEGMEKAVKKFLDTRGEDCKLALPPSFDVTVKYKEHPRAFRNSHFPGAELTDEKTVRFASGDYDAVLRFFHFCV